MVRAQADTRSRADPKAHSPIIRYPNLELMFVQSQGIFCTAQTLNPKCKYCRA